MKFNRKKAIQEKNKIQEIAVKGSKGFKNLLLTWATGCGKSLASLKIIKEDYKLNPKIKGYLICKETTHLQNWREEIKEHKMDFITKSTEMFLYASLHKYKNKSFVDYVILDECHGINERRLNYLKNIIGPKTRIIFLSATVSEGKKHQWGYYFGKIGEFNITIDEAIKKEILPHPSIFVHYFKLDNNLLTNSITLKEYGKEFTINNLTQQKAYDIITEKMVKYRNIYEEERHIWAKNMWVNLGSRRKKLLAEFKTQHAKNIVKEFMFNKRRLLFTGSKKQAELLSNHFVHSGNSTKHNNNLKKLFNSGKINDLSAVNMFRESVNLFNIEKGLIVQLDNVKLSFIQMLGRVFRSDIPEMHLIIFKNTQDEKYLKTVLNGFNINYIKQKIYE